MLTNLRTALARLTCAAWILAGVALPLTLLRGDLGIPALDTIILAAGAVALATLFSAVRFTFGRGDVRLDVAAGSGFVVVAAVLLQPGAAALVGALAAWWAARRLRPLPLAFVLANASLAAGAASYAAHELVSSAPSGAYVLPAALLAAGALQLLSTAGLILFQEAREPGAGARLVARIPLPAILMLTVGLPATAVAAAAPFLDMPLLVFIVLAASEGFAYLVLRLLHEKHRDEHQNTYLRKAFSTYMPTQVADHLLASDDTNIAPGGEQRDITVMFCDVREFTSWAERNQPDDVIVELNRLLTDLAQAILNTDGTLDKFTGDGLMAFWGAPGEQPDHAERAMRAIPQIMMRVREFNLRRQAENKPPLEVGIGINSGLAMVGNVGHLKRLNFTAVGDTVNLAARLEGATKELGCPVLLSESTFLKLPMKMQRQCARMESINVKGRRDSVRLYSLQTLAKYRVTGQPQLPIDSQAS